MTRSIKHLGMTDRFLIFGMGLEHGLFEYPQLKYSKK